VRGKRSFRVRILPTPVVWLFFLFFSCNGLLFCPLFIFGRSAIRVHVLFTFLLGLKMFC
jgi:hypothetical protein